MSLDLSALGLRASAPSASATGRESLGQQDFLTLLVTQLRNQDPLNPLDNETFVAQLAQFSTVSGITEMNGSLASIAARAGTEARASAPQWVGRVVGMVEGQAARVSSVAFAADGSLLLNLDDGQSLPLADVTSVA
jgi:flagellar basal-body rod modification protein FlgD